MGISSWANVVCGFAIDVVQKTEKVKKYNEDNGVPYYIDVPVYEVAMVGNIEVCNTEINPDALYSGEYIEGLKVGWSGYSGEGKKWLGAVVCSTADYRETFKYIDFAVPEEVRLFAEKYNIEPKWFLSLEFG